MEATVDGVPIQNLQTYRVQSPMFNLTFPGNNAAGVSAGTGARSLSRRARGHLEGGATGPPGRQSPRCSQKDCRRRRGRHPRPAVQGRAELACRRRVAVRNLRFCRLLRHEGCHRLQAQGEQRLVTRGRRVLPREALGDHGERA